MAQVASRRCVDAICVASPFAPSLCHERLTLDHARARRIEAELRALPYVASVLPVETNIVIFDLDLHLAAGELIRHLACGGVKASSLGPRTIRFVFHLDVSDDHLALITAALRSFTDRASTGKHNLG